MKEEMWGKGRRVRTFAGVLGVMVLASGCGVANSTSSSSSSHFFIKIASADPAGTPEEVSTETFLKEIKQKSGGRLNGQMYLNGQLGTSAAMVTAVEQGTIQMNYTDASFLSGPVPQLAALNLPFLFSSEAAAQRVYDGPIGKSLNDQLIKTAGVRVLGWHSQGSRTFDTVNKQIVTAADLRGEKIRVVPAATTIAAYKAWGAVPITLDPSEVPVGLKQGTIDGIDQQYLILDAYGWYQSIKYVTESNHQFVFPPLYINEKFFQSLPADLQKIVQQAATDATRQQRALADKQNETSKKKIEAAGIKVVKLDPSVAAQLRTAAAPAYQMASQMYGQKFMDDLIAAAKAGN